MSPSNGTELPGVAPSASPGSGLEFLLQKPWMTLAAAFSRIRSAKWNFSGGNAPNKSSSFLARAMRAFLCCRWDSRPSSRASSRSLRARFRRKTATRTRSASCDSSGDPQSHQNVIKTNRFHATKRSKKRIQTKKGRVSNEDTHTGTSLPIMSRFHPPKPRPSTSLRPFVPLSLQFPAAFFFSV